jgi:hypothetical protein
MGPSHEIPRAGDKTRDIFEFLAVYGSQLHVEEASESLIEQGFERISFI